jgi:hypothetical protein
MKRESPPNAVGAQSMYAKSQPKLLLSKLSSSVSFVDVASFDVETKRKPALTWSLTCA